MGVVHRDLKVSHQPEGAAAQGLLLCPLSFPPPAEPPVVSDSLYVPLLGWMENIPLTVQIRKLGLGRQSIWAQDPGLPAPSPVCFVPSR